MGRRGYSLAYSKRSSKLGVSATPPFTYSLLSKRSLQSGLQSWVFNAGCLKLSVSVSLIHTHSSFVIGYVCYLLIHAYCILWFKPKYVCHFPIHKCKLKFVCYFPIHKCKPELSLPVLPIFKGALPPLSFLLFFLLSITTLSHKLYLLLDSSSIPLLQSQFFLSLVDLRRQFRCFWLISGQGMPFTHRPVRWYINLNTYRNPSKL